MIDSLALRCEQLSQLFTIVICINDQAEVVYASETAGRHIAGLKTGSDFFDLFSLLRPTGARDMDALHKQQASLFLMKTRDERFAVRGQMLEISSDRGPLLCFCGAPWLFWMSANRPDVKLGLGDFSPQDSQLDQLFLMNTEQRMVSDLEKLNSDLKLAKQETEQAQAEKNALFARMSHEMRTPLNGVVSALSLLSDEKLPATARQLLQLAESSSRNLLHVINYVLDISKIESGDSTIDHAPFELPRLLNSVTDIVRARAVEKGLELHWHCSPQLGVMYLGDKAKLRQCLLNLITNAIKFTDSGSVNVRAMPPARIGREGARFEVEDTGRGIGEADQNNIFEPFWTGTQDGGPVDAGTGLGLDIVRRNVELLGGEFGLSSRVGRGSLFWIEVPLDLDENLEADSEPAQLGGTPGQFAGRVLLVDDNATNLMLGRMILESLGVTVDEAQDGGVAVTKALDESFDLVLMDISMPVMDGVAATEAIRRQRSATELPIVALTAFASTEEKARCLNAGMNDYLTKPIVRDRLAEQLDHWLSQADEVSSAPPDEEETHESTDQGGHPALSIEILDELRSQIGESNLGTVLDRFADEVQIRWEALESAFGQDDVASMTREAHTLSSTCRSLGLTAAGDLFSLLEEELRRSKAPPAGGLAAVDAALERGLSALDGFRARRA